MRWHLILASVLASGLPDVAADPLKIGSPSPTLQIKTWVKGEPVGGIEKGKVYVVEFWGTTCGPCVKCMPQMTALQQRHPAVTVVALSAEREQTVRDFLAKHDKEMGFRVGFDAGAKMWEAWMGAADLRGIPTAFVVDSASRIGWIGHPAEIDEPLRQILDGTFDPQLAGLRLRIRAATRRQEDVENDRLDRYNKVAVKVEGLIRQRKWDAARAAVEEACRNPGVDQDAVRHLKVSVLAADPATAAEAVDYAVDLAATTRATRGYDSIGHARSYLYQAQSLMQGYSTSPDARLADLTVALAEWAVEDLRHVIEDDDRRELEYDIHQLQARAHAARKRYEKAVAHQESALALLPKINPQNRIANWRPIEEAQLKATLAEYKRGVAGVGK